MSFNIPLHHSDQNAAEGSEDEHGFSRTRLHLSPGRCLVQRTGLSGAPPAPEVHLQNSDVGDILGKTWTKAIDSTWTEVQKVTGEATLGEAVSLKFFSDPGVQTVFVDLLVGASLFVVPVVRHIQQSAKPDDIPGEQILKGPKIKH